MADLIKEKIVPIMLDVQGTLNGIDNNKAKIFMKLIEKLRIKYQADKVIINISSHIYNPTAINKYIEILDQNLLLNIIIDEITYLCGRYNYYTKEINELYFGFNQDKIKVFEEKYFKNFEILGLVVIDDRIDPEYIKKFKDIYPILICRPSKQNEEELKYDNLMCKSSLNDGFNGVLECLSAYLDQINSFKKEDIVNEQKNVLFYLSAWDVKMLFFNREFTILIKYIENNKLAEDDYDLVANEITNIDLRKISTEEIKQINTIIELLKYHLNNSNNIFQLKL